MAWILTLVGRGNAPVNIQIPREHALEQVKEVIHGTPDGQWALIYGVVDGQITKIYIRPGLYGMSSCIRSHTQRPALVGRREIRL